MQSNNIGGSGTGSSRAPQILTFTSSGNPTRTANTYADITGMTSQNLTIPAAGDDLITVQGCILCAATGDRFYLGIVIDGAAVQQIAVNQGSVANTPGYFTMVGSIVATLPAGSVSFKPQYRNDGGSIQIQFDDAIPLKLIVQ